MSSLREVITDVMADVAAEVAGTTHTVGSRHVAEHGSPPLVRWVPVSEEIGAAPKREASPDRLTRTIAGLDATFRVICWGTDFDQAEDLRDALLRGLHRAAPAYARAARAQWLDSEATTHGEAVVLTVVLKGFVPAAAPTTVTITTTHNKKQYPTKA